MPNKLPGSVQYNGQRCDCHLEILIFFYILNLYVSPDLMMPYYLVQHPTLGRHSVTKFEVTNARARSTDGLA